MKVRASGIEVKLVTKTVKFESGLLDDINRLITPLASLSTQVTSIKKKKYFLSKHIMHVPFFVDVELAVT